MQRFPICRSIRDSSIYSQPGSAALTTTPEKWVFEFGDREGRFTTAHAASLRRRSVALRIVALYFMRGDLQVEFDVLGNREVQRKLVAWLLLNRNEFGINLAKDDINLFSAFLAHNRNFIERARFLYQHYGNSEKNSVSIYTLNSRRNEVRALLSKQEIANGSRMKFFQNPEDHILASQHLNRFSELDHIVMDDFVPEENNEFDALEFVEQAFKGLSKWRRNPEVFVNFAGYLSSPTGMGKSGRSMKAILDAAGVGHSDFELPSPVAEGPSHRLPRYSVGHVLALSLLSLLRTRMLPTASRPLYLDITEATSEILGIGYGRQKSCRFAFKRLI